MSLSKAARVAFRAIQKRGAGERFYFYALCIERDGSTLSAIAWTEEALARAPDARRYSAAAPYREVVAHAESALRPACFDVLRELDGDALFGRGVARSKSLINVVDPDMTDAQWLVNADRLIARAALERAKPHLSP
jgi:hypothetical protein